jgi:hypothetical protein
MNPKDLVEAYIDGWRKNDKDKILSSLASDIMIIESHGPKYTGIKKVDEWISSWIEEGSVVKRWDITSFYMTDTTTAFFEWSFECEVKQIPHTIEGISIIKIKDNKISYMREYKTSKPVFEWSR